MMKEYHILNGDALKAQLPKDIKGEIIIARECLVDGPVEGEDLATLFQTRAKFISNNYEGFTVKDYYGKTVGEFEKIQCIPDGATINLWFEDDLFCQVNFWFIVSLITTSLPPGPLYLIRPEKHTQFGFAGLNESDLQAVYQNKSPLQSTAAMAELWNAYQTANNEKLLTVAQKLEPAYPFILPAVKAQLERSADPSKDRPTQALRAIMESLQTDAFGPVFQAFCQQESIYGFGDLQVKRLFDNILKDK